MCFLIPFYFCSGWREHCLKTCRLINYSFDDLSISDDLKRVFSFALGLNRGFCRLTIKGLLLLANTEWKYIVVKPPIFLHQVFCTVCLYAVNMCYTKVLNWRSILWLLFRLVCTCQVSLFVAVLLLVPHGCWQQLIAQEESKIITAYSIG